MPLQLVCACAKSVLTFFSLTLSQLPVEVSRRSCQLAATLQVFGSGPGSVFKPDVIYAMQQGKVCWLCHARHFQPSVCICV